LAQSGAILLYAAEKSGKLIPNDGARRAAAWQWFMMGSSDLAGASGTLFLIENVVPEKSQKNADFFKDRLLRMFSLLDQRLSGREFIADEVSIADLMLYPIYATRKPLIDIAGGLANLNRWGSTMASRPSVQKGMNP
jgi:GST-like protein